MSTKSDREIYLELEDLTRRSVELCRTLAFRQERPSWIKIAGLYEAMLEKMKLLKNSSSLRVPS